MSDNQDKPSRQDVIDAFRNLYVLQNEAEGLVAKYERLDLEPTFFNRILMGNKPGTGDALGRVSDINCKQIEIIKKYLFPHIFSDIRNKPKLTECLDEMTTKRSPSPAKLVRATAKLIDAMKGMLKV